MLHDRLLCSVRDEAIQRASLLAKVDVAFDRAVEIASAREAVIKDV